MTDTSLPRQPMARLSRPHDPIDRGFVAGLLTLCLILALVGGVAWAGFEVVAGAYRQQHCVYLLGHWLSVERTTNPLFCQ